MQNNNDDEPGARVGQIPSLQISFQDDPEVVKKAAAEDYSLHVVPKSWRSSRGSTAMTWFALMSAMFWVVVGSTTALAVGTINALIGIALSVIVYGLLCGVASKQAARSGTTVVLISRTVFGQVGAVFAAALFGITITYYAIAEGSIIAIAIHAYFSSIPLNLCYLIVAAYMTPIALRGVVTWLDKFNAALLPLYVIGMIAAVIWAIVAIGFDWSWLTFVPEGGVDVHGPGWLFAFTIYMGVWVVVMMTWDTARFGRSEDARFNARVVFGIPFYIVTLFVNGVIGIFLAHTIPIEGELSETSAIVGIVALMGLPGLILVWASQTRINSLNFYLASCNFQSFFARAFKLSLPRTFWVVVVGVIVFLVMLTDVFSYLLKTLEYQGVVIVAWVSIIITHVIWRKIRGQAEDQIEFRPGRVPLANPGGLTAWIIPSVIGCVLVGAGGPFGAMWASPITMVLSVLIYAGSLEFTSHDSYIMARPHDPREEVENYWEARIRCHRCEASYVAYEMDRDPSAGHQAICLACAANHSDFLKAARIEAKEFKKTTIATDGPLTQKNV